MESLLAPFVALEQSGLSLAIRNAHVLYPLANIFHVLGVIVFFALVAAMDMAVLRRPPDEACATITRTRPFAFAAFALIALTGATMFIAEAGALMRNPAFLAKLAAIMLGFLNLVILTRAEKTGRWSAMRLSAALSLMLWLFAAAAGRGIAYL